VIWTPIRRPSSVTTKKLRKPKDPHGGGAARLMKVMEK
jgi:hypothetical protein